MRFVRCIDHQFDSVYYGCGDVLPVIRLQSEDRTDTMELHLILEELLLILDSTA